MAHRLLLDVSSLMYRAFFAMGDTVRSPDGAPIGAVHGYLDMVRRLILSRRPDEVIHVYDHEWRPMARTDIYPGYKSKRPPDPEGLPEQFPTLRRVLDVTGMPQAQTPGWEAEDAIGALCSQAGATDRIEMVSGDRDLLQLVRDPGVKLLYTLRGVSELREFDEATVLETYGVRADRYADFAILRGDPSDDLPGVRGVGQKTARELVLAYPTLDELLADAAAAEPKPGPLRGKPALRARLREAGDYIEAMRRIVPVNADAPLDLWAGARDEEALSVLAEQLGVRGPVQRLVAAMDSARD
ncbi:MAG TPA: 5'-3' exonuclease H3TH domain-containing protein [Actinomycetota bacterium]